MHTYITITKQKLVDMWIQFNVDVFEWIVFGIFVSPFFATLYFIWSNLPADNIALYIFMLILLCKMAMSLFKTLPARIKPATEILIDTIIISIMLFGGCCIIYWLYRFIYSSTLLFFNYIFNALFLVVIYFTVPGLILRYIHIIPTSIHFCTHSMRN